MEYGPMEYGAVRREGKSSFLSDVEGDIGYNEYDELDRQIYIAIAIGKKAVREQKIEYYKDTNWITKLTVAYKENKFDKVATKLFVNEADYFDDGALKYLSVRGDVSKVSTLDEVKSEKWKRSVFYEKRYNGKGKLIYYKDSTGFECRWKYDKNGIASCEMISIGKDGDSISLVHECLQDHYHFGSFGNFKIKDHDKDVLPLKESDVEADKAKPAVLHFATNISPKERKQIEKETYFRYYWGNKFRADKFSGYVNRGLLKYFHPNKVVEAALNLEYAMGYRGYYDDSLIVNDDYSILEEIERCRNNPRYFTPSYYYNYYNKSNNILSLLNKEFPLGKLTTKLISMQFLPRIMPDCYISKLDENMNFSPLNNYNGEVKFSQGINTNIIDDNRFDARSWEYCSITLDAKDALESSTVPQYFSSPNFEDGYTREECGAYVENNRIILDVKLFGNQDVYQKDVKLPKDTLVKILRINVSNDLKYIYDRTFHKHDKNSDKNYKKLEENGLSTIQFLATRKEIEDYRKQLQAMAKEFEKK